MKTNKRVSQKRVRRTKEDIENSIQAATLKLIKEKGFKDITVSAIIREAKVELPVFYNRYGTLEQLFDKLVRSYDYWLNDSVRVDMTKFTSKKNQEFLLNDLIDSIYTEPIMQKILLWELTDLNDITRRTANNRESNSELMSKYFKENFPDKSVDINAVLALFISGIYYLCLHQDISTFAGVDFRGRNGQNKLKKIISWLIDKIHSNEDNSEASIKIAKSLLEQNVEVEIVQKATGLSKEILTKLSNSKEQEGEIKRKRGRPKQMKN